MNGRSYLRQKKNCKIDKHLEAGNKSQRSCEWEKYVWLKSKSRGSNFENLQKIWGVDKKMENRLIRKNSLFFFKGM